MPTRAAGAYAHERHPTYLILWNICRPGTNDAKGKIRTSGRHLVSNSWLLLRPDARVADDLTPLLHFNLEKCGEFCRRAAHAFRAVKFKALGDIR